MNKWIRTTQLTLSTLMVNAVLSCSNYYLIGSFSPGTAYLCKTFLSSWTNYITVNSRLVKAQHNAAGKWLLVDWLTITILLADNNDQPDLIHLFIPVRPKYGFVNEWNQSQVCFSRNIVSEAIISIKQYGKQLSLLIDFSSCQSTYSKSIWISGAAATHSELFLTQPIPLPSSLGV